MGKRVKWNGEHIIVLGKYRIPGVLIGATIYYLTIVCTILAVIGSIFGVVGLIVPMYVLVIGFLGFMLLWMLNDMFPFWRKLSHKSSRRNNKPSNREWTYY